ncbi:LuxR C-terminal-related transcriptional regulator [Streptomyces sp. NPDC093568]|uniref:LuxR C-terminal-related transcriptional regulator n=1 Tax=Streptomyces sp. NPDC093568 TaxID=3366041 RepID=UPI00382A3B2F
MVSVLVVNDQSLQRLALRMLLAAEPDIDIAGEATNGADAVGMSAALRPDVVLLAGHPYGAEGIDTVRRVAGRQSLPHAPRVLVLTSTGHEEYAYAALRAGADGFLLEDAAPGELASAVRIVAAGDAVVTPALTRALIDAVREQRTARPGPGVSGLDTLTGRERDVLIAVACGWSNAEIAERLAIAPTTVKTHVSNILGKIGARARVQAVTFAYETGLVRPAA